MAAEQWLHENGWRDAIIKMQSAKSDEFLVGFRAFAGRLELEQRAAEKKARRAMLGAAGLAALAFSAIGLWAGAFFFVG